MEGSAEKECSALGGLFQHIISDFKGSTPAWEDFITKATKLQSQLKATVLASAAFLDSFQKIADMATCARGATKEIGTALTRLCLRQRSVEARLKTFASSIMECLVIPLQEKLEDWKKMTNYLDKEHAKEFKRARQDIKKKSSDTLRLQKKVRKVGISDIQRTLDYALQDVSDKYILLEETEKHSVRKALIEERGRFCIFVTYLKPVIESELTMLQEITHLQEVLDALSQITGDPHLLPSASEQVIIDVKGSENTWAFQTPPSSPSSLGSRKSSICSISSLNSSSSGSTKSHSPSHQFRQWSYCQQPALGGIHLASVSSRDSGFTSQDTLFLCPSVSSPMDISHQLSSLAEHGNSTFSTPSSPIPSTPCGTATWPNLQDSIQFDHATDTFIKCQRPHTISSAYERVGHSRPALTVHTFQPLRRGDHQGTHKIIDNADGLTSIHENFNEDRGVSNQVYSKPTIPERNGDKIKRKPSVPEKSASVKAKHIQSLLQYGISHKTLPDFNRTPPDQVVPHPVYANTSEIMGKHNSKRDSSPPPPPPPRQDNSSSNKLVYQKDLATILTQSLLHKHHGLGKQNSDNGVTIPGLADRFKNSRPLFGGSETLPRSKGTIYEDSIREWYLYSMAVSSDVGQLNQYTGTQRRPASIAGYGNSSILPGVRAHTLHRTGSNSSKPPTPVRRSSSISSQQGQPKNNVNSPLSNTSESFHSTEDIKCTTNQFHQLKNSATQNQSVLSSALKDSVKLVSDNRERKESNSYSFSNHGQQNCTVNEKDDEEDVATSRARLIQALNATFQHQTRIQGYKSGQNTPHSSTPKQGSQQDLSGSQSTSRSSSPIRVFSNANNTSHAHTIGHGEKDMLIKTLNAKFSPQNTGFQQIHRKPSLPDPPNHRSNSPKLGSVHNLAQRRQSQPALPLTISTQVQQLNISDDTINEKSLKQCFLEALNAKLAQQQQFSYSQEQDKKIAQGQPKITSQKKYTSSGEQMNSGSVQHWYQGSGERHGESRLQNLLTRREGIIEKGSCRESLMDQIRRGTTLRKVTCNDRSAPRLS